MAGNDWLNQTEELMRTWTKAQQSMWETWRGAMSGVTSQPSGEAWDQAVGAWKEVMQRSLSAQADFVKFWSESLTTVPLAPKQMQDMSTLIADTAKRWTDTQSQIWTSWLDAVAKADTAAMAQSWDENTRKAFDTWRETVNGAIEVQRKLTEGWIGAEKKE